MKNRGDFIITLLKKLKCLGYLLAAAAVLGNCGTTVMAEDAACQEPVVSFTCRSVPLITKKAINIYEEPDEGGRVVGTIPKNGIVYWIKNTGNGWRFVESGEVRGYAEVEELWGILYSDEQIEKKGTDAFAKAEAVVDPSENEAYFDTYDTVNEDHVITMLREQIVQYALAHVGTPYVWAGEDIDSGVDCSGFTMEVYRHFGIELPHSSGQQAYVGTQVSIDELEKGDIVIFANNGNIHHVGIYAGNGKTVEALNEQVGVVYMDLDLSEAVWGIRIF